MFVPGWRTCAFRNLKANEDADCPKEGDKHGVYWDPMTLGKYYFAFLPGRYLSSERLRACAILSGESEAGVPIFWGASQVPAHEPVYQRGEDKVRHKPPPPSPGGPFACWR